MRNIGSKPINGFAPEAQEALLSHRPPAHGGQHEVFATPGYFVPTTARDSAAA